MREENFTDQNSLSVSSLYTDYLNLDRRSGCGKNSERENIVHKKCTFYGVANHSAEKCFKIIRKDKGKACAAGYLDNIRTERTPQKCSRCVSEDHLIAKCTKPPKENEKQRKQVCFNEKYNRSCDNGKNNNDQKIYASMKFTYDDNKFPSRDFGEILQLTN